jgi:hypothetical protein
LRSDTERLDGIVSLHQEQKRKIDDWMTQHVSEQCPNCGTARWWEPHDSIYALPNLALDTVNLKQGLELIAVSCKMCSFTGLFLAKRIGV